MTMHIGSVQAVGAYQPRAIGAVIAGASAGGGSQPWLWMTLNVMVGVGPMFKRAVAVTGLAFELLSRTDGSAVTSGVASGYLTQDGSTQIATVNAPTHLGNGQWAIDLTAAEMDAAVVGLLVTHPDAIAVHLTLPTVSKLVSDLVDLTAAQAADAVLDESLAGHMVDGTTGGALLTLVFQLGNVALAVGGLNDLSATDVRQALGLATPNLDDQLSDIAMHVGGLNGEPMRGTDGALLAADFTALDAAGVRDAIGLASPNLDVQLTTIASKTNLLTSGGQPVASVALLESGQHLVTVRGDSYMADSARGPIDWTPPNGVDDDWPDLTGATAIFTSRRRVDDVIELTKAVQILSPTGPGKTLRLELTAPETAALTPGPAEAPMKTNKFDVEVTLADGSVWTPIRGGDNLRLGGHTIVEDQTR